MLVSRYVFFSHKLKFPRCRYFLGFSIHQDRQCFDILFIEFILILLILFYCTIHKQCLAVISSVFRNWGFNSIHFVQKCPQNAGNAVSETQISKHFRGSMPPDPPTIVSSLWSPPHSNPGYATCCCKLVKHYGYYRHLF